MRLCYYVREIKSPWLVCEWLSHFNGIIASGRMSFWRLASRLSFPASSVSGSFLCSCILLTSLNVVNQGSLLAKECKNFIYKSMTTTCLNRFCLFWISQSQSRLNRMWCKHYNIYWYSKWRRTHDNEFLYLVLQWASQYLTELQYFIVYTLSSLKRSLSANVVVRLS